MVGQALSQVQTLYSPAGKLNPNGIKMENIQSPEKLFKGMLAEPARPNIFQQQIDGARKLEELDKTATLTDGNDLAHVVQVNEMVQRIDEVSMSTHKAIEAFNKVVNAPI